MAPHGGEEEWPHALVLPVVDHAADDGGEAMDAAAAHADRDARSGFQASGKAGTSQLLLHFGGHIRDAAIGELLAHKNQAGKLHDVLILTSTAAPWPQPIPRPRPTPIRACASTRRRRTGRSENSPMPPRSEEHTSELQ